MDDAVPETVANPIRYLEGLKTLKVVHPEIKAKLDEYIRILEESKTHKKQIIENINHHFNKIHDEINDMEDIYSGIDILSIHLPNYEREQKNWNTLEHKEITLLVSAIKELIEASNRIEHKIIEKPVVQKEQGKTEQEKIAFENVQRQHLNAMDDATSKIQFSILRSKLKGMIKTEEEKILTNNLALEIFGKKVEDLEWEIKRKITRKNVKTAVRK